MTEPQRITQEDVQFSPRTFDHLDIGKYTLLIKESRFVFDTELEAKEFLKLPFIAREAN